MGKKPKPFTVEEFWSLVRKGDGCWEWIGEKHPDGYGQMTRERKTLKMHRVSWELANGEIPSGMFVLHSCDTPWCVRPDHLFLGTQADNIRDAMHKGRGYQNLHRTHCRRGHDMKDAYVNPNNGSRSCRACSNMAYQFRHASPVIENDLD